MMKENTSFDTRASDIDDLLDPVRVAIELGATNIPVVVGSVAFAVYVTIQQADRRSHARTDFVGVYVSQNDAESGLRQWILERWHEHLEAPWDIGDGIYGAPNYWYEESEWISDMTDQEIIQFHFHDHGSQKYRIDEIMIMNEAPRTKRNPY